MVKASNLIHMRERICADRSLRLQSRNRDKGDAGVYPKSGETVVSLRDEQERLQVVNDAESGKCLRYLKCWLIAEFCIPVLHVGEDLIQVCRMERVHVILRLHRAGVVLRINNQHSVALRERDIALHDR